MRRPVSADTGIGAPMDVTARSRRSRMLGNSRRGRGPGHAKPGVFKKSGRWIDICPAPARGGWGGVGDVRR